MLGSLVLDVDGDRMDASYISQTGQLADHFTIVKGNAAPTATDLVLVTAFDTSCAVPVLGSDLNGGMLSFVVTRPPNRGKLVGWNPASGAATSVPTRGYHGTDSFDYQVTDSVGATASVTVGVTVLPTPDLDNDGLPDAWESATGATDPTADADSDQSNNRKEWLSGTNPQSGSSFLRVNAVQVTPQGRRVEWTAVGGVRYRISYSDDLATFTTLVRSADQEIAPLTTGAAGPFEFFDDYSLTGGAPEDGSWFYRLLPVDPDTGNAAPTIVASTDLGDNGPTGRSATFGATFYDANRDHLKITYRGRLAQPLPGRDFSLIMLPDTQYYTNGSFGGES